MGKIFMALCFLGLAGHCLATVVDCSPKTKAKTSQCTTDYTFHMWANNLGTGTSMAKDALSDTEEMVTMTRGSCYKIKANVVGDLIVACATTVGVDYMEFRIRGPGGLIDTIPFPQPIDNQQYCYNQGSATQIANVETVLICFPNGDALNPNTNDNNMKLYDVYASMCV